MPEQPMPNTALPFPRGGACIIIYNVNKAAKPGHRFTAFSLFLGIMTANTVEILSAIYVIIVKFFFSPITEKTVFERYFYRPSRVVTFVSRPIGLTDNFIQYNADCEI